MTDVFSPEVRSRVMARVSGKNTKPELIVRKLIHSMGFRFRIHKKTLPGKPDIVLVRHQKIILVHGCFWHGHKDCPRAARPTSNKKFWNNKLDANIQRDKRDRAELRKIGYSVLTLWECQIRNLPRLQRKLATFLRLPLI